MIRRAASVRVHDGLVGAYVHGAAPTAPTAGSDGPTVGRVGVLVGARAPPTAAAFFRQVAQHIAGFSPATLEPVAGSDKPALLEQPFLFDDALLVRAAVAKHAAKLLAFARFERGEGLERHAADFAAEVQAQLRR